MKLHTPKEPAWLKEVAQDSFLRMHDLAVIFGYKSDTYVSDAYRKGNLPKPDSFLKRHYNFAAKRNRNIDHPDTQAFPMWKVSTIRKEIRRRLKLIGEEQYEKIQP